MFKKLFKNVTFSPQLVKQLIYMTLIGLVYGVLLLINFKTLDFELDKLANGNYWIQYGLTIGFAIVIMFLAMQMKKDKLKIGKKIVDLLDMLSTLKYTLETRNLYDKFIDYLEKQNDEKRLKKYRQSLIKKRDTTKKITNEEIKKLNEQIQETYKEDFDISKQKVKMGKLELLNVNVIFAGYSMDTNEDKTHFTGRENLAGWVAPALLSGMMFSAVMLALSFGDKQIASEQIKNILTMMWVSISYLIKGLSYAEYSIDTVYHSVLENRIGKVRNFLTSIGLVALVEDNTLYKYKIDIEEKEASDEQNSND